MTQVGYKKPPKHSQFKKGVSGNPKGRPKRPKKATLRDPNHLMAELLSQKVVVTINGKPKKLSKQELLYNSLLNKAVKGDARAMDRVIEIIHDLPEAYKNQNVQIFFKTPEADKQIEWFNKMAEKYLSEEN